MTAGEVYFIEGGGRIKIGYSLDADERIKALATASPHPLKIIGRMPGNMGLERAIHKKLSEYRVQREWFQDCSWVRELIGTLLKDGPSVIGYRFVPPIKAKRPLPREPKAKSIEGFSCFGTNPYEGSMNKIFEAGDYYVNERIAKAIRREKQLGLVRGTLINPMIKGYYTPERWIIAGKMIFEVFDQVSDLNRVMFDAIVDDDLIPEETFDAALTGFAISLKRSLQALFANPDLDVIDLGSFEWAVPPNGTDFSAARVRSSEYQFAYGRRLAA